MKNLKLWMSLTIRTVTIMLITFLFIGYLGIQLYHPERSPDFEPMGWTPILLMVITGLLVSTGITMVVFKRFLIPIEHLIVALRQVAAGQFDVRLEENGEDSDVQQMNLNFNKMVQELQSTETLQSDFIQNVSHEFKTPLASIEGYATLLDAAEIPDELHEYAHRILESTCQLSSLTSNILRLSKLENQQILSEQSSFSLDEQLRQAILSLEPLWNAKGLTIDMDLPEVNYYGNEQLLLQVWINLFSNAIKFTPGDGGIITAGIQTEAAPGWLLVTIQDNGLGMTEEVQKHIFDKFYQGERNRNIEGNGLGLALVKKIISLSGGRIDVESQPCQGATFKVWLPV